MSSSFFNEVTEKVQVIGRAWLWTIRFIPRCPAYHVFCSERFQNSVSSTRLLTYYLTQPTKRVGVQPPP